MLVNSEWKENISKKEKWTIPKKVGHSYNNKHKQKVIHIEFINKHNSLKKGYDYKTKICIYRCKVQTV